MSFDEIRRRKNLEKEAKQHDLTRRWAAWNEKLDIHKGKHAEIVRRIQHIKSEDINAVFCLFEELATALRSSEIPQLVVKMAFVNVGYQNALELKNETISGVRKKSHNYEKFFYEIAVIVSDMVKGKKDKALGAIRETQGKTMFQPNTVQELFLEEVGCRLTLQWNPHDYSNGLNLSVQVIVNENGCFVQQVGDVADQIEIPTFSVPHVKAALDELYKRHGDKW